MKPDGKHISFGIIASLIALLVVGTEDIVTSGHVAFATNRGINVQTSTNQDQGCEPAGGTSGITNACTATSGPGSTQTSITLQFGSCFGFPTSRCQSPFGLGCDNFNCQSRMCSTPGLPSDIGNCVTDNGVQLTSCTFSFAGLIFTCTLTEPGTSITSNGGVTGDDVR